MVESVANGLSLIALEEWTMAGAIEAAIDLLRDRLDPNSARAPGCSGAGSHTAACGAASRLRGGPPRPRGAA